MGAWTPPLSTIETLSDDITCDEAADAVRASVAGERKPIIVSFQKAVIPLGVHRHLHLTRRIDGIDVRLSLSRVPDPVPISFSFGQWIAPLVWEDEAERLPGVLMCRDVYAGVRVRDHWRRAMRRQWWIKPTFLTNLMLPGTRLYLLSLTEPRWLVIDATKTFWVVHQEGRRLFIAGVSDREFNIHDIRLEAIDQTHHFQERLFSRVATEEQRDSRFPAAEAYKAVARLKNLSPLFRARVGNSAYYSAGGNTAVFDVGGRSAALLTIYKTQEVPIGEWLAERVRYFEQLPDSAGEPADPEDEDLVTD